MPVDPPKPPPALEKVIIAADPAEPLVPPSTPYRTTDAFEAIVALEASRRDNARLRAARRRSHVGVVLSLAASCMALAVFGTVLIVRHVPADAGPPLAAPPPAAPPPAVRCPFAAAQLAAANAELPDNAATPPLALPEGPTALDELGGEAALRPLAKEITAALLADPVLRRNPRIAAVGSARLETAVRQSLVTLVDGTADSDLLDASELMWEIRPTHAEWEAATTILDSALEKHKVSDPNRATIGGMAASNESLAVDDTTMRANALARRASVGLSCPEEAITSRPLETSDQRIVSGCGKRAIYMYVTDVNTGVAAWQREVSP